MARNRLAILTLSMTLSGCFNVPLTSKGKLDSSGNAVSVTQAVSKSVGTDKEIATFDPDSKTDVHLTTPKVTGLAGASVVIAPGSLGIAVDLVVEQASDFGETSISGEMGLADDIQVSAASPGMIIRPTENVDLKKPLTLSMPLPAGIGFRLQGGSRYGIFYKYFDPTQQKLVTGLKIFDDVNVKMTFDEASGRDILSFEGYFGAYWAAILSREVKASEVPPPKPAEEPIINKAKVAVIQNSGVVKETEVVQKQAVPEIVWSRPSISFSVTTRMVTVSVKPPEGQKVEACKIDLFESVSAQKGISLESPLGTQVEYLITNTKDHALVARFRCTDAQSRITITPWSDVVLIPGVQTAAPVTAVADELCSDDLNYLTIAAQNEMGNYVPSRSIPKVGKCKYAMKLFNSQVVNFYLHTPNYDFTCGLATHALGTTTQTLSCDKYLGGSLGSNFMTLPAYNVNLEIDFTASRTAPKITVSKLPCAIQDFYMQVGSSTASVIPTAAEKMVHKGACEFEFYTTSQPFMGSGGVTFRNLDGTFTCAQDGAYLYGGNYYENICGTGFRKFYQMGTTTATGHRLIVRFGESATEGGLNPWRTSSFHYKLESNCPEKLYISSAFHGTTPVEGKNVLYRNSSCSYYHSFFAEDLILSNYDFKIKTIDGTRVCGGVATGSSIALDCAANAPAISFAGNATEKTYQFSMYGDPITGQFSNASLSTQPTYCEGFYVHGNALNGFNNTANEAMVESKQCYFEKLWTPTASNLGFNITTSSNRILSAGFTNDAQPTINGSMTRLNWFDDLTNTIKTLPVGVVANTTYKIILDSRAVGESRLKIETYNPSLYVCPDDLHLIGDNLFSFMPSVDNKFTYHGACNYSFTFRNETTSNAFMNYRVTNNSQSVQCGYGTGASPSPNIYDPRSANVICAGTVDPYGIDVPAKTTVRFYVHRASNGEVEILTTRSLAPDFHNIELAGQAASALAIGSRGFHGPAYSNGYFNNSQSFIWNSTGSSTFFLKNNSNNYFCGPVLPTPGLLNAPMPMVCRYSQNAPTNVFGSYGSSSLRLRFIPALDVESSANLIVEPNVQINDIVRVAPKFAGATMNAAPSATPNGTSSTTPGSMTLAQTWTAANGDLYLFGGQYLGNFYNGLWRYAPGTGNWTLMNGTTVPNEYSSISGTLRPGARTSSVGWMDVNNNRLYLFGGNGYGSNGSLGDLNDLWYYDIANDTWNFIKGSTTSSPAASYPTLANLGIPNSTYNPPARVNSSAFTDAAGNFWIYGGYGSNTGIFGDLWKFTPTSGTANLAGDWAWMGGTQGNSVSISTDPVPLNRHSAAVWTVGNVVYLFGGFSAAFGSMNDLWSLNLITGTWTSLQAFDTNFFRIWENFTFQPDNRPYALNGLRPMTWLQNSDSFWLYNYGAFYNYRPSLNQWSVVSPGDVISDVNGNPFDPVVNSNNYDPLNDLGRKIEASVWSGSSGFYIYGGYTYSAWNDLWRIQFPTP